MALINVDTAVGSSESRGAFTAEPVHPVHTDSSIVAGVRVAVVDVLSAGGPLPAVFTDAGERVTTTHACSSVQAGAGRASAILGCVACTPSPSRKAGTAESVSVVIAGPSITACGGITLTFT